MTSRRDLLIGAACVAASGAGYALTPRRHVSLLGQARLSDVIPTHFGAWTATDVSALVAPATEGSLVAKLYGQTLERVYENAATGAQVMVLLAHGDTQTNALQLHRPEVCYPAFGFQIQSNQATQVPLTGSITLPCRRMVADAPDRREVIIYWTRLGKSLPVDGAQQRMDRMKAALRGVVADGLLARFSVLALDPGTAFAAIERFVPELIRATARAARPALIGGARAEALSAAGF